MARIEWHEGLSLGIMDLDGQHKQLLELCNWLLKAVRDGSREDVAAAFRQLRQYTITHFNAEEAFMESVDYPGLPRHKLLHAQLKRDVKHYQDVVYRHGEVTEGEIRDFLKQWLLDHILQNDLDIRKWVQSRTPPE